MRRDSTTIVRTRISGCEWHVSSFAVIFLERSRGNFAWGGEYLIHTGSFKQTQIIAIAHYCYYLQNALQLFSFQVFASLGLYKSAVSPTSSLFPTIPPSLQVPAGREDSPAMDLWSWIPLDWSALTETLRSVIPGVGTGSLQMQLKGIARPLSGFLCPDSQGRDRVLCCSVLCLWTSSLPSWQRTCLVLQLIILDWLAANPWHQSQLWMI